MLASSWPIHSPIRRQAQRPPRRSRRRRRRRNRPGSETRGDRQPNRSASAPPNRVGVVAGGFYTCTSGLGKNNANGVDRAGSVRLGKPEVITEIASSGQNRHCRRKAALNTLRTPPSYAQRPARCSEVTSMRACPCGGLGSGWCSSRRLKRSQLKERFTLPATGPGGAASV